MPMASQERLAQKWETMFPEKAYKLVTGHKLPAGARLISVASEIQSPTAKELAGWNQKKFTSPRWVMNSNHHRLTIAHGGFTNTCHRYTCWGM